MVSLQLDIDMEFIQCLKCPKRIYLQFPRANATWWQWQFMGMPICDWLTLWLWQCSFQYDVEPNREKGNGIAFTPHLSSSFYLWHQNEIWPNEFGSTLFSRSYQGWSVQNTQSRSIPLGSSSHNFFHRGPVVYENSPLWWVHAWSSKKAPTGLDPMTSTIPVQCSTKPRWKQVKCKFNLYPLCKENDVTCIR